MKCMFQDCPFDSTRMVNCKIGTTGEDVDVHICKFHYDVLFNKSVSVSMEVNAEIKLDESVLFGTSQQ